MSVSQVKWPAAHSALFLLAALPVRAEINKPSFDCYSETLTAIQTLLCEDPLLGAWEGRLAAWAARTGSVGPHRAWLQGLAVECGLGGAKKLPPRQLRFAAILSENRERPRRRSSARPSW